MSELSYLCDSGQSGTFCYYCTGTPVALQHCIALSLKDGTSRDSGVRIEGKAIKQCHDMRAVLSQSVALLKREPQGLFGVRRLAGTPQLHNIVSL